MMLRQICSLLVLGVVIISCRPSSPPDNKEIVKGGIGEKINAYLSPLERFGLSGSFLVASGDSILFHKAYGLSNREDKVKNSINTLFSTGSITKQFTATAILKLEEEGLLMTSDSISKYFENVPADKSQITIHHLLSHTSGLPAIVSDDDFDPITRQELVDRLMASDLHFEPGSDFLYSNSAYGLLAILIEDLTKMEYEDYLADTFLSDVGITTIGYSSSVWESMDEANNYVDEKNYGTFQSRNYPNWNLIGNGGLLTTSLDLFKWMKGLKNDQLISSQTKEKLLTPNLEDFAYGWEVYDDGGMVVEHTGSGDGNNSIVQWFVDQDIIFIALSNTSFVGNDLLDYIYDDMFWLLHNEDVENISATFPEGEQLIDSSLFGTYSVDSISKVRIEPVSTGFKIQAIGQEARSMFELKRNYTPNIYLEKNKVAFDVLQSAIENDDFSGFMNLIGDEERVNRTKTFISSYVQALGIENPKVVPYLTYRNEDALQSYVAITNEAGQLHENRRYPFLSIAWTDEDTYMGLGSVNEILKPATFYFTQGPDNTYIGYNWTSKKIITIQLEKSGDSRIKITIEEGNELAFERL